MLALLTIVAGAAIAPLPALARPAYFASIPRALLALDCTYPEIYSVTEFSAFLPSDNDENRVDIKFSFTNPNTTITTTCSRNSTSPKIVPVPGLTERFACDNTNVEFIWDKTEGADNGTLTMIEAVCPEENPSNSTTRFEASGTVVVKLVCTKTDKDSVRGDGQQCGSFDNPLTGVYRSMQPRPVPPKDGGKKRAIF